MFFGQYHFENIHEKKNGIIDEDVHLEKYYWGGRLEFCRGWWLIRLPSNLHTQHLLGKMIDGALCLNVREWKEKAKDGPKDSVGVWTWTVFAFLPVPLSGNLIHIFWYTVSGKFTRKEKRLKKVIWSKNRRGIRGWISKIARW